MISVSMNNEGSKSVESVRGQVSFVWGNLLGLNDSLSLSIGGVLSKPEGVNSYENNSISYSVPYRKYLFSCRRYASDSNKPLLAGPSSYLYRNKVYGQELTVKQVNSRKGRTKLQTFLSIGTYKKCNFINQRELKVQRIKKTNVKLGILYDKYMLDSQVNFRMSLAKGVSWLGAQDDMWYGGAFSTHGWIWNMDITYGKNMQWGNEDIRYKLFFHGQQSSQALCGADEITIGGLYSVRGFSGEQAISGKSGYYMQQEWQFIGRKVTPYIGVDIGAIYGKSSPDAGHVLAGVTLGIRGTGRVFYDVAISTPLLQPKKWGKNSVVLYMETGIRL